MEAQDYAMLAAHLAGAGVFLALRRARGFWAAYALGFAAALVLLLGFYIVLMWGPPAIVAFVLLYMGLIATMQLLPLLLLLPLLHGALLWRARRAVPPTEG
jgi:hypothetical protein